MTDDLEYPPCKECHEKWTLIPALDVWDVESVYLHHKADCSYAKEKTDEDLK